MTDNENTILFSNPSYETAFLGLSSDDKAIYCFNKMVEYLVKEDSMTEEEAIEFIEYNTVRSLPYCKNAPIILYPQDLDELEVET